MKYKFIKKGFFWQVANGLLIAHLWVISESWEYLLIGFGLTITGWLWLSADGEEK